MESRKQFMRSLHGLLKTRLHLDLAAAFHGVLRQNATELLERRRARFAGDHIFQGEDLSQHFADQELADVGLQNVVASFIIERLQIIYEELGEQAITSYSFADIGDSSGIFLKALGKKGTSVNVITEPLRNIARKGISGVQAHLEWLPFQDNSFDHVLCFEVLEHAPSPIAALQQLARVCRQSAFISVPYVSRTRVHPHRYRPDWPIYEHHIFEFSVPDLRTIVSHTPFSIKRVAVVEVLDGGHGLKQRAFFLLGRLVYGRDLFAGCFKKFVVMHLVKKEVWTPGDGPGRPA